MQNQTDPIAAVAPENMSAIVLVWDAENQQVAVNINPAKVKHWAFARMLLQEAVEVANLQCRNAEAAQRLAQLQQQQQNAAVDDHVRRQMQRGKLIH